MGIQTITSKIDVSQLNIGFQDNDPSGYTIVSIDGLGAPDAQINTQGSSVFDGEVFNSSKAIKRTINLTLAINGYGDTEETNRTAIYGWFPIRKSMLFGVITSSKDVVIDAYVERLVMNMSSKVENAVITLVSPYPYFRDRINSVVNFATNSEIIAYSGDVESGFILTLTFSGASTFITITHTGLSKTINIDTDKVLSISGGAIQNGDVIVIDTRSGNKKATLTRASTDYNILPALGTFPDWLYLEPGNNPISYSATSGEASINLQVDYSPLYQGV